MAEKKVVNFTTSVLMILLVGVSIFAGAMWMKAKTLEHGNRRIEEQGEMINQDGLQPLQEGAVLGEEEIAKITTGGMVKGEENAPITIVEFSEYQCPFCKKYVDETYFKIWNEYGDKIHYIFHDYPLDFHTHAQKLAEVARCAGDQGKYWEMHDLLFEKREEWVDKQDISVNVTSYARNLDLDIDEFLACLDSGKYTQVVKDDFALGQSVGVSGTPTFFINGQMLIGAQPFTNFKAVIDAELAK